MSDQFVAEIRIFPFNFAPKGWAFCDGQLMAISQNTALFSLLGTTYGGDGKSNFALPNLQGCAPVNAGQGPGLSLYSLGQTGGNAGVTLLGTEMPSHAHSMSVSSSLARFSAPGPNAALGRSADGLVAYTSQYDASALGYASSGELGGAGGSQPHNNMMPYLGLNFCIALQGIFPSRS
ncbi:MAG TPA: tail fiber protein [Nevskia sp.]|jgi:microcystin-dependent protein|nr:tail fiber protein [Nevskia sp.]